MVKRKLSIKSEAKHNLSRPWRLPKNLFIAAICTFAGIGIGIIIHTFHRGLPYIAADLFIWTLATYNVSQLGSDSSSTIQHITKNRSLRELFFVKNTSLFILALPIDLALIIIACAILNDWSKFWLAITLAISAVIIGLGLGNVASVAFVYKPTSLWGMRKDRLKIFEYLIFVSVAYVSATTALLLATIPGWLLLKIIGIHSLIGIIIGLLIVAVWSVGLWLISANLADKLGQRYRDFFISRLNGKPINIKNKRLKRILKT
jgi:hypothetical protein